jgi:hypothetical protein
MARYGFSNGVMQTTAAFAAVNSNTLWYSNQFVLVTAALMTASS